MWQLLERQGKVVVDIDIEKAVLVPNGAGRLPGGGSAIIGADFAGGIIGSAAT